jgi:hypothetical protein
VRGGNKKITLIPRACKVLVLDEMKKYFKGENWLQCIKTLKVIEMDFFHFSCGPKQFFC